MSDITTVNPATGEDLETYTHLTKEEAFAKVSSRVPMRRVADIDEIVQAMIWACSDENSFMNGQALPIDGGLSAV